MVGRHRRIHRTRDRILLFVVLPIVVAVAAAMLAPVIAAADQAPPGLTTATNPACPPGFDTAEKASPEGPGGGLVLSQDVIEQVRVGRHDPCYDRLVFDVAGTVGGYRVSYVNEVISDPKGEVLTVPGQARLLIVIGNPAAHRAGGPRDGDELIPTARLARFVEFRSVIFAGSFENVTSVGLGVNEPHGFRVFRLPPGPSHPHTGMLVVDVAHD